MATRRSAIAQVDDVSLAQELDRLGEFDISPLGQGRAAHFRHLTGLHLSRWAPLTAILAHLRRIRIGRKAGKADLDLAGLVLAGLTLDDDADSLHLGGKMLARFGLSRHRDKQEERHNEYYRPSMHQ